MQPWHKMNNISLLFTLSEYTMSHTPLWRERVLGRVCNWKMLQHTKTNLTSLCLLSSCHSDSQASNDALLIIIIILLNYYMARLTRTTKFMSWIGWNRFCPQSRFSHLDWHLDQLHFAVKKLQTKLQKYWLFSSKLITRSYVNRHLQAK